MNHDEIKKIVQLARKANEQKQEVRTKENLKRHVQTKFKTTMIGALAKFEEAFGSLWGHGIPDDQLTKQQLEFRNLWNLTRTEVLNNGNNQLRAALSEIDNHTVKYNKVEYKFIVQNQEQ